MLEYRYDTQLLIEGENLDEDLVFYPNIPSSVTSTPSSSLEGHTCFAAFFTS